MYVKPTGATAAATGGVGGTALLAHTGANPHLVSMIVAAVTLVLVGAAIMRVARTRKRDIN